eukprot:TCONS_00013936-protein
MLYSIDLFVKNICQPEISDNSFSIDFFIENVNQSAQADKVYIFAVYETLEHLKDNTTTIQTRNDVAVKTFKNISKPRCNMFIKYTLTVSLVRQNNHTFKKCL